jgi:hypothetical protein
MSTVWDVGEQVVVRKKEPRSLAGIVASSAAHVAFAALTVLTVPNAVFTSQPTPVMKVVRIARRDLARPKPPGRASAGSSEVDTAVGMSTGKLAQLFPRVFSRPTEDEEAESEPFFLT